MNMTLFDNKNKVNKNIINTFLLELHYSNFNCYFDNGIISPVKYIKEERTENDIQTEYPEYLVLTNEKYLRPKEESLFLEIILTGEECGKYLIESNLKDIFLCSTPIPVSRISNIYYTQKAHYDKIIGLVNTGGTSYIPPIFSELPKSVKKKKYTKKFKAKKAQILDFKEKLFHYDKVMGLFAFMKNTDLYYGKYADYSKHYFSALSVINQHIKATTKDTLNENYHKAFQRILRIENTEIEEASKSDLLDIVYGKDVISKQLAIQFILNHKKNEKREYQFILEEVIKQIKDPLQKKKALEKVNQNSLHTFFEIVYLAYYGQKVGTGTNKLKNAFAKEIPYNKAEVLLALFGIYYGYKTLDPYDVITLHSNDFEDIIDKNTHVKFKLDSRLDYVTVESIYQFTFNGKTDNGNFDYLISPKVNNRLNNNLLSYKNNNAFDFTELTVIDKNVITIGKKNIKGKIEQLLVQQYEDKITVTSHIFPWIMKQPNTKGLIHDFQCNKNELLKFIKNKDSNSLEYLLECIEFDLKHKKEYS